jgi:hypothetical protein
MRQQDILELLQETSESINLIELEIKKVSKNENIKEVLKAKVKTSLEHLRSCLEYCTQDIYELIIKPIIPSKKNKAIYFPYGKDYNDFYASLCRNSFKKLSVLNNEIYQLLESIQPHKLNSNWLVDLCVITNYNKHNKLRHQNRINSKLIKAGNINIAKIVDGAKGKIIFNNSSLNGIKINRLEIDCEHQQIYTDNNRIKVEFIKWADFTFSNTDINILIFLKYSLSRILEFQSDLYKILYKNI